MKSFAKIACALTACLLGSAAHAQTAPPQPDVVVTADRLPEVVRAFINTAAAEIPSEDQIARWARPICPGVVGVNAPTGEYIADRIAYRARQVDLEVQGPGCRANIVVFITPDSDRLSRAIADEYRELVGDPNENPGTLGRDALADFVETSRPVRWWHVAHTYTDRGGRIGGSMRPFRAASFGADSTTLSAPTARVSAPSRLHRTTQQEFDNVLIIVDAQRAQGKTFEALADYVAMVALAQINIDAEMSAHPSILNLFSSAEQHPTRLTDWDVAYLEGLYSTTANAMNARQQEREMGRRMVRDLSVTAQP